MLPTLSKGDTGESLTFERLLAELSARFIGLPAVEVDAAIRDALRHVVRLLDVDRCQLIRLPPGRDDAIVTHSWAVEGVPTSPPGTITTGFPWVVRRLKEGVPAIVPSVAELPANASVDKATWQRLGVKSNLTMPMRVAGEVVGALALGSLRRRHDWPEDLVDRVRVLVEVFANALAHKQAQEALDASLAFERTVSQLLAALLTAGRSEQDAVIERGLADMARALGAERATLWQRVANRSEFTKTHRWIDEGVTVPPDSTAAVAIPWIASQIVTGNIVHFGRLSELPVQAQADVQTLRALGIAAAVLVPLKVSGNVVGVLSFGASREDRDWPDALVTRIRLMGEVFASVLARDASERREKDAQALATHAARVGTMGVVAASLVHELTQPLAASLANAETALEILASRDPDIEELRKTVADIVADDRRVGDIIRQLRKFLRRGDAERAEHDLGQVIEEVLRFVGGEAGGRGIEVSAECAQRPLSLIGDRVQIQQVLLNLLLNALDAVAANEPGSRRVRLTARTSVTGVTIEVTDNGAGMDEPTLARVFQPFFTTKPGGMGLGLSISQSIVAGHGGALSVRSTPGRGASFRVELPSHPLEVVPDTPHQPTPADASGTVYVIDDDASMRRALQRQLQGAGYRVETFGSAQGYLDRPQRSGVACIVTDVRMPGLSGLDLQASLARANRELPMVFVSGHGDIPTTVHAMRNGAVGFLPKPFTKAELLAAVGEALARSRAAEGAKQESAGLRARYETLTSREREVLGLVVAGLLNKVIGDRLGAAETTIKIHRARVMAKMGAASVPDLVRMAGRLGLKPMPEPSS